MLDFYWKMNKKRLFRCVLAEMSVVDLLSDDPTVSVVHPSVRNGAKDTSSEEETSMIAGNNETANARYGSAPDPPSSSSSVRQRLTHKRWPLSHSSCLINCLTHAH